MATVKLIDSPSTTRPKMDRPCQITLEPHEAAALMVFCYSVEGPPSGPRGAIEKVWRGLNSAYGLGELYRSELVEKFSARMRSQCEHKGWPTIHGIVDAPKGGQS